MPALAGGWGQAALTSQSRKQEACDRKEKQLPLRRYYTAALQIQWKYFLSRREKIKVSTLYFLAMLKIQIRPS